MQSHHHVSATSKKGWARAGGAGEGGAHLEAEGHLALAEKVGEQGQREDVEGAADEAEHDDDREEGVVADMVGRVHEEGDAQVDVDGRLGQEGRRLEHVRHRRAGRLRHVVVGVVLQREAREEDAEDARELDAFAERVADVAGAHERANGQVRLLHTHALEQQRGERAQQHADHR